MEEITEALELINYRVTEEHELQKIIEYRKTKEYELEKITFELILLRREQQYKFSIHGSTYQGERDKHIESILLKEKDTSKYEICRKNEDRMDMIRTRALDIRNSIGHEKSNGICHEIAVKMNYGHINDIAVFNRIINTEIYGNNSFDEVQRKKNLNSEEEKRRHDINREKWRKLEEEEEDKAKNQIISEMKKLYTKNIIQ